MQLGLVDAQVLGQLAQLLVVLVHRLFGCGHFTAREGAQHVVMQAVSDLLGFNEQAVARFDAQLQGGWGHAGVPPSGRGDASSFQPVISM